MKTIWTKQGLIYQPSGYWWNKTHGYLPTAYKMADDAYGTNERIRVYFAGLDENQYGRIGYVDLDPQNPAHILYETPEPVLDIGEPGAFDDCGVTPSCIVPVGTEIWMYYIGWQRLTRVPYSLLSGLAVSKDRGKTFERMFNTPILERTREELNVRSAPFVIHEAGFRMWYVSQMGWTEQRGKTVPSYVIAEAKSEFGDEWGFGSPVLSPTGKEFGIGRPWVIKEDSKYKMFFSARQQERPFYPIAYAESRDGHTWTRGEDPIAVSETGWDSEMVCFPSICGDFMFYNGNEHGKDGFGYATRKVLPG